ncbi:hypothetical protein [Streptomyces noursei]|nr:hypothetical protein [Streptomyces noursei]MCZ1020399.1 hypothetical protein [Streptomyces noursei]
MANGVAPNNRPLPYAWEPTAETMALPPAASIGLIQALVQRPWQRHLLDS